MFEKPRKYLNHSFFNQLRDVRALGLIAFGVIVLLVSWSGVKTIQTNYKLQQQITHLNQENSVKELENTNQKLRNEYYKTSQYLELAARRNFGLALPGETELLVPKEVAMVHVKGVDAADGQMAIEPDHVQVNLPFYQRNWQAWMSFFLHRTNGS